MPYNMVLDYFFSVLMFSPPHKNCTPDPLLAVYRGKPTNLSPLQPDGIFWKFSKKIIRSTVIVGLLHKQFRRLL